MLIAIIDDGIFSSILCDAKLVHDLSVSKDGTIRERREDETILTDHGTTCAAIIRKYAPDAEFCSLRVFHEETLSTNINALLTALKWCYNTKIPIVHLSIGSPDLIDYTKIRQITAKMIGQGQIIVSAHCNKGGYSAPACIAGVFGVSTNENMTGYEYSFVNSPQNFHLIKASSRHELSYFHNNKFTTQISNSYAAPTVTAAIHNLISKHPPFTLSVAQVYKKLSKHQSFPSFVKPDFIHNALIVNPSGYPVLKQHLFFNCVGEFSSLTEIQQTSTHFGNKCSLVYLPFENDKDVVNKLFNLHADANFSSLLFGGRLSDHSFDMQDMLIWSEDACHEGLPEILLRNLPQKNDEILDVDFPIVNIYGDCHRAVEVACVLRKLFITEGYQCMVLCDHKFSYLYGLDYVSETNNKKVALKQHSGIYDLDIAICCLKSETLPNTLSSDEFYVALETYHNTNNGNAYTTANNLTVFNTNGFTDLLRKIEKFFS